MPEAQPEVVEFTEANTALWLGMTGVMGVANLGLAWWAIKSIGVQSKRGKEGESNLVKKLRVGTHVLLVLPFLCYAVYFLLDPFSLRGILPLAVSSLIWSFASDILLICYVMLAYSWALMSSLTLMDREKLRTTFTVAFAVVLLVLPLDVFFRFSLQAGVDDRAGRATFDRIFLAAQFLFVLVTYFSLMASTSKIAGFIKGRSTTSPSAMAVAHRLTLFRRALSVLMGVYTVFICAVLALQLTEELYGFFAVYFGVPVCYMFAGVLVVLLDGKLTVSSPSGTPRTSSSSKGAPSDGASDFSAVSPPPTPAVAANEEGEQAGEE